MEEKVFGDFNISSRRKALQEEKLCIEEEKSGKWRT
jgi:hypothetical protein